MSLLKKLRIVEKSRFLDHMFQNVAIYVLAVLFSFLFFYHLDYSTLTSWDEAWYAVIARTMVESGDYMHMKWLDKPFYDHPPMGMWLMASSFHIFGINEFAVRFPSALLGIGTVLLTYATGKLLFKRPSVGLIAAIVLGTAVWFVIRARSGNLDTVFTFFYMASIYSSIRARSDARWFLIVGASFGALIMTKTLVGVSVAPLILYASFPAWTRPKNWGYMLGGAALWSVIVLPWYVSHMSQYAEFSYHHFEEIGTRNRTLESAFNFTPAKQVIFYVHMGVRKWYYLWILAVGWIGLRTTISPMHRRENIFLLLWNAGILFPFLSSERTELWHLIPVYLPMSLIIAHGSTDFVLVVQKKIRGIRFAEMALVIAFVFLAIVQAKTFWPEVITPYRYEPEGVQIAKAIQKYPTMQAYLDDDFLPEAIFYAGRDIIPISAAAQDDPEYKNMLPGLFRTDEQNFIVATRWWTVGKLDDLGLKYKVLEKNKEFTLISRP